MNIKFIDRQLDLVGMGGSMYSLDLTASELCRHGHDVSIITLDSEKNKVPNKTPYKIVEENVTIKNPIQTDLALKKILDKYSDTTDIYHIFDPTLLVGAGLYKFKGGRVPIVGTLNSYLFCTNFGMIDGQCHKNCNLIKRVYHSPHKAQTKLLSMVYRVYQHYIGFNMISKVDRFLPISPTIKEIYSEFGFNKDKMIVILQPVNTEFAKPSQYLEKNFIKGWENKFNILYVGRLEYNKGVDLLIDAISRIGLLDICLHVVGEGDEKRNLENLSRKLNSEKKVNFYGYIPNEYLSQFYSNAQVFVHPVRWSEPMGRTILEAMSFGLPLIVSDIGAPKWLSEGANLIFEHRDSTQLSKRIMEMYSDHGLRERLSKNAKSRVKEFDYRKSIKKLSEVYDECI